MSQEQGTNDYAEIYLSFINMSKATVWEKRNWSGAKIRIMA